jgi:hypothetical protein
MPYEYIKEHERYIDIAGKTRVVLLFADNSILEYRMAKFQASPTPVELQTHITKVLDTLNNPPPPIKTELEIALEKISMKDLIIAERDATIAERDATIILKDREITDRQTIITSARSIITGVDTNAQKIAQLRALLGV